MTDRFRNFSVAIISYSLLKLLHEKKARKQKWRSMEVCRGRVVEVVTGGPLCQFTRMSACDFERLLKIVGPSAMRKNTNWRRAIPVSVKLAVTLRFLSTGESYHKLASVFQMSKQAISNILTQVCEALIEGLRDTVKTPTTPEDWLEVAEEFDTILDFPHCMGAIGGRRVSLHAILNGEPSENEKHVFSSFVLMGIVDANFSFLYADVCSCEKLLDGKILEATNSGIEINGHNIGQPAASPLPGRLTPTPYVLVADEAFDLHDAIMTPCKVENSMRYATRVYNGKIIKVNRAADNAFGYVSSIFRVLKKPLLLRSKNAESVVLACIYLHNFLMKSDSSKDTYAPSGSFDEETASGRIGGSWRRDIANSASFVPVKRVQLRTSESAKNVRHNFIEYFSTV